MLTLHHIGCLVENIEVSCGLFLPFLSSREGIQKTFIASQEVHVCMVPLNGNTFLELIEPTDKAVRLKKMLSKGINYYHLGFETNNFEDELLKLQSLQYKQMPTFESEAFGCKRCVFFISPESQLVEIIEV